MQVPRFLFNPLSSSKRLSTAAVVAGLLALNAYVGWRASSLRLHFVLGGIGAVVLSLIALRDMAAVLTLLVAASAAVDVSIGTGTLSPVNLTIMMVSLLTALWLLKMLLRHSVRLVPSELNRPLLGFLLAAIVSWLAGYAIGNPWVPLPDKALRVQLGQFGMFALSVAACLLVANHRLSEDTLKRWTGIIIFLGVSLAFVSALTPWRAPFRLSGSMLLWPFALLFAQLLFNADLNLWIRVAGWLVLPVWGYWVWNVLLEWKGAWIPAVATLMLLIFFKSRRVFLLICALGAVFFLANSDTLYEMIYLPEVASGSTLRPFVWRDVIAMGSRSLLLGLGPVNYMWYWQDPTFVSISRPMTVWDTPAGQLAYRPPSHNMWVDIFAQTGLIGLALFTWAMVAAVWLGFRLRRRFQPGFRQAYVYGVLCGLIAVLVASGIFAEWLIPFVYNTTIRGFRHTVYSWLLLGSLVWLERESRAEAGRGE